MFQKSKPLWRKALPFVTLLVCVPLALLLFTGLLGGKIGQESLGMAEQSIRRAAVQCYALEGAYPANFVYLEEKYGVSVDTDRYFVFYRYIASNLMPEIRVLPV